MSYDERADAAKRIKSLRLDADMTQDELGKEAGVSRATINNWENGTTVPQSDKLALVYRALGVPTKEAAFTAETEEWLEIMGVLVEKIPADRRQPVMNQAVRLVADGDVGDMYDHQDLPRLDEKREKHQRAAAMRMAANRAPADPPNEPEM